MKIYAYICTHIHTYIRAYVYIYICVCVRKYEEISTKTGNLDVLEYIFYPSYMKCLFDLPPPWHFPKRRPLRQRPWVVRKLHKMSGGGDLWMQHGWRFQFLPQGWSEKRFLSHPQSVYRYVYVAIYVYLLSKLPCKMQIFFLRRVLYPEHPQRAEALSGQAASYSGIGSIENGQAQVEGGVVNSYEHANDHDDLGNCLPSSGSNFPTD